MRSERGSATLVVVTLVAILAVMVVVNGNAIHQLRQELRLIDKQQQKKFQSAKP